MRTREQLQEVAGKISSLERVLDLARDCVADVALRSLERSLKLRMRVLTGGLSQEEWEALRALDRTTETEDERQIRLWGTR